MLEVELASASTAVKIGPYGIPPTGGLALLDWDAVLRVAAAAYDRAAAHLREDPDEAGTMP
ncbi:hypothetical protein HD597_000433 [Nonomuraea thailandensis]|uniref:Uncharacterized protein n=1 Tax=Nonomuraea thailandensis TaxID=1188745 RepID=A0A9X2GG19_9ACTN|nr:hypothetical protein [Nonomuraea thailandensis]MCP2353413.1 hypothetical protein [Nonomuraea thailandensis]